MHGDLSIYKTKVESPRYLVGPRNCPVCPKYINCFIDLIEYKVNKFDVKNSIVVQLLFMRNLFLSRRMLLMRP